MKKISILGLGYIGLPSAAYYSKFNYHISGYDIDKDHIENLKNSKFDITEPGLSSLLKKQIKSKKIEFVDVLPKSDIYIVCVPTPLKKQKKVLKPDLSYLKHAIKSIKEAGVNKKTLILIESTCPVGTTEKVSKIFSDDNFPMIAYCPERVLPGNLLKELASNERVVGGIDTRSTNSAFNFYKNVIYSEVHKTDSNTAEMCKLVENSFRDTNIAFANEISLLSDKVGINAYELINLANKHPRVNILEPGPGVGGHCIAVDPWFLINGFKSSSRLLETSRKVNDFKPKFVLKKLNEEVVSFKKQNNREPKIAILGISFKPDIDDIRESPSLDIAMAAKKNYKDVYVFDPYQKECNDIDICKEEDIFKCDLFLFLVNHTHFHNSKFTKVFHTKNSLDFCNFTKSKVL